MVPTLLVISLISFTVIQLPPGDYLTSRIAAMSAQGGAANEAQIAAWRHRYGLDQPFYVQYGKWMYGLSPVGWHRGPHAWTGHPYLKWPDMGMSFEWGKPVTQLIGERLALTMLISVVTLLFTWIVAIPIGIYSAVHQYSWADHTITLLGYLGLATPNFLLALIFMYVGSVFFGTVPGGLFSSETIHMAPWIGSQFLLLINWHKVADLFAHLWIPVIVIGMAGTASLIRIMRGNLLDELRKQYVVTARAKGLKRWKLILRYPVRVALNPIISTVGWVLPSIVSGSVIVAVVLGLPTTGPLLLHALMDQDMYLAGSMVMMLSLLTVVGTLVSDVLLIWLDPRIGYGTQEH